MKTKQVLTLALMSLIVGPVVSLTAQDNVPIAEDAEQLQLPVVPNQQPQVEGTEQFQAPDGAPNGRPRARGRQQFRGPQQDQDGQPQATGEQQLRGPKPAHHHHKPGRHHAKKGHGRSGSKKLPPSYIIILPAPQPAGPMLIKPVPPPKSKAAPRGPAPQPAEPTLKDAPAASSQE